MAAVGVAVLAAVCASGPEQAAAVRAASELGPLPADRYVSTPQDYQRSQQATALLVRQCMAGRGHPDFPLDPRYPTDPLVTTAVTTGYGVLDIDDARRWGYGWDPAEHPHPQPKGRRMTQAEFADLPACDAEANQRLMRGIDVKRDWLYPTLRTVEVDKAVKEDPRLRAAWDAWSNCVAAQGFSRYSDPAAAYTDRAWQRGSDGNTSHTRRERATAVADVTCQRRYGTARIWHDVRARQQTADIAAHRDRYAAALRALLAYRANVGQVIRQFG